MTRERIPRKDDYVNDLIELTDARLDEAGGNRGTALAKLSSEEQKLVEVEIIKMSGHDPASVRYFLENYFVINAQSDEWAVPLLKTMYPFMESQEVLWDDVRECWALKIAVWWICLKARQIGWSTLIQGMIFSRTVFNRLVRSLIIADEKIRSNHIFEMAQLAYNYMPWWAQPEVQYERQGEILKFDRKDKDVRMDNPGLNSTIYVDAANKPTGSSRGFTLHNLHASEFSLYIRPKIVTSDIIPAIAKRNPLTVSAIEGTAEGQSNAFDRLWAAAMEGKVRFRPMFAAWWKERKYSKPFPSEEFRKAFERTDEEVLICSKVHDEFDVDLTSEQLNWRRGEREEFAAIEGDADKQEQEYPSYPESAFRAEGFTAFPKDKLRDIEKGTVRPPIWFGDITFTGTGDGKEILTFIRYDQATSAPFWVWEWPIKGAVYANGADVGHGIPGADFSACGIWGRPRSPHQPIRQVAEYKGYAGATKYAKILNGISRFYNLALLAPEINTITACIEALIQTWKYPNLYRWRRPDKIRGFMTNYLGWETNHKSRADLIDMFRTMMVDNSMVLRSKRCHKEATAFIDDGSGKFEAAGDQKDDVLIGNMIAVYILMHISSQFMKDQQTEVISPVGRDFVNTDSPDRIQATDSTEMEYESL